jgi:hypothetical protein
MAQKYLSRNRKPVRTGKSAATDLTADFGTMLVESSPATHRCSHGLIATMTAANFFFVFVWRVKK